MKMMGSNKKRVSSRLGGILKEHKARIYIIRRCVGFFRFVLEILCK
ncbi:hypothetical protein Hanom_Chr16g01511571 [Helianthus anomalus]